MHVSKIVRDEIVTIQKEHIDIVNVLKWFRYKLALLLKEKILFLHESRSLKSCFGSPAAHL